jgi:hypothetical protein
MKKDSNGFTEYTYTPGKHLYHFDASDTEIIGSNIPGWENYMGFNVVLFADDEKHAATILESMLNFRLKCKEDTSTFGDAQVLLDHKHQWKFTLAPTNQFYCVGWAYNDTIL